MFSDSVNNVDYAVVDETKLTERKLPSDVKLYRRCCMIPYVVLHSRAS